MVHDAVLWLLFAGLLGWFAAAFSEAYVCRITAGAPLDGHTFEQVLMGVVRRLRPRFRRRAPDSRAAVSRAGCIRMAGGVLVMMAACLLHPAVCLLHSTFCMLHATPPAGLLPLHLGVCAVLLTLALIDARTGFLPDALTLPLLWAGLMIAWAGRGVALDDAVAGAASGYLTLWLIDRFYLQWRGHSGLGGGDMKLVAALGAWLGWAVLPGVILMATLAGLMYAALRSYRSRLKGPVREAFAFGPFLAFAGVVGLHGHPVVQLVFCLGNTACSRLV